MYGIWSGSPGREIDDLGNLVARRLICLFKDGKLEMGVRLLMLMTMNLKILLACMLLMTIMTRKLSLLKVEERDD